MGSLGPDGSWGSSQTRKKANPVTIKKAALGTKYKAPAAKKVSKPKATTKAKASIPRISSGSAYGGGGGLPQTTAAALASGTFSSGRSMAELKRQAAEAVDLELSPQIRRLEGSYNQENRDYGGLINQLKKQLGLTQGDVKNLYAALDVNLQANLHEQQKSYDTAKTGVGTAFDQLSTMLGSNYDEASGRVNEELSRLNLADTHAADQLTADKAYLQGMASTDKARNTSMIDALNKSAQDIGQLNRGQGQQTNTMLQGQLQQEYDKSYNSATTDHQKLLSSLRSQRDELKAGRGGQINQTLQALMDQEYQRQLDASTLQFNQGMDLAKFGLSAQGAESDSAYKQNSLVLQAQKLQNDMAAAAAKKSTASTGLEKAMQYLQTNYKSSAIPQSALQSLLIDAINGNTNDSNYNPQTGLPGYDKRYISRYAADINSAVRQRGWDSTTGNALINAMHYYFGI